MRGRAGKRWGNVVKRSEEKLRAAWKQTQLQKNEWQHCTEQKEGCYF